METRLNTLIFRQMSADLLRSTQHQRPVVRLILIGIEDSVVSLIGREGVIGLSLSGATPPPRPSAAVFADRLLMSHCLSARCSCHGESSGGSWRSQRLLPWAQAPRALMWAPATLRRACGVNASQVRVHANASKLIHMH